MRLPLEAVPNFSEGRDRRTIDALADTLSKDARLLDVHADPDHNRSVFTLVGSDEQVERALVAGVACARERIDLRRHDGAHPRVGAADVVPVVPLRSDDMERACAVALTVARRVGELGLPVFLYGELAPGRGPAFFRRGGVEGLQRRLDEGELEVDFGPARLDASAGAVLVGARRALIAFNVNLSGAPVEVARDVAQAIRETGGGFRGVRALALELTTRGVVQISMNVEDPDASPLHVILERIEQEAARRDARVLGCELIGLMPAAAAAAAAGAALRLDGLDGSRLLETRLLER